MAKNTYTAVNDLELKIPLFSNLLTKNTCQVLHEVRERLWTKLYTRSSLGHKSSPSQRCCLWENIQQLPHHRSAGDGQLHSSHSLLTWQ